MSGTSTWNDIARELAHLTATHAEDWLPVAKARYAMYATFKAVREIGGGTHDAGTVLTQLYTCVTAVDPIIAAKFTPVYADISPRTLALDTQTLDDSTRDSAEGPVAVVLQHTFGIIDDAQSRILASHAHKQGALVVEDCAHCLGRMAYAADGSPVADVSVHSFGVEKMVRSSFGGAVWINPRLDSTIRQHIRSQVERLPVVAGTRAAAIHTYPFVKRVLAHLPQGLSHTVRSALAHAGLFEFPVDPVEQRGGMSAPILPDAWVYRHMSDALNGYEQSLDVRRRLTDIYRFELPLAPLTTSATQPLECPDLVLSDKTQPLLAFPVYLANEGLAAKAVRTLRAAGVYARAWYRPLLFPGVEDTSMYHVDASIRYPVCERCSRGAVLLPVDLDEERTRAAARLLRESVGV